MEFGSEMVGVFVFCYVGNASAPANFKPQTTNNFVPRASYLSFAQTLPLTQTNHPKL